MTDVQKADEFAEVDELDTVSQEIKEQESAASTETSIVDETIPEKYRGMTAKQLAERLETTNRDLGRYTNELGEVRRLADELIKSTLYKPQEQAVSKEVDFFENPKEAIRQEVNDNPVVQQAAAYAVQAQQVLAKQRLYQLHPDTDQILQDQNFAEWIGKSPVRQAMLQSANNYDLNAAHELLSTYKELRGTRQDQVSEAEKASRNKAMNAASVETGGSGEKSKKIFRRTDLMRLYTSDRKRYDSMQDEIMRAYAEGRVR